jgi:DNA-binding CsgD family transcriptional regulator
MLPPDEQFLSLVDAIYAAAVDETLWPSVLEELTAISESQAASLWILESGERLKLPTFRYVNFDPSFIRDYLDFMTPDDPTNQYLALHPDEKIVQDASFISEREKDRHPYYDWHGRGSDTRHRIVGTMKAGDRLQSGIALHRTRAKGPYGPTEADQFAILFRHIERALEIGFRLGTLGNLQQATFDLLDRNPLAIVLLDDRGRVVLANSAAQKLDAACDGIRISAEGLWLAHSADHRKLERCIADALKSPRDVSARPGGALWAVRPSGKRSFSILVSPVSRGSFTMTGLRPAVCIVIADPDKDEALPIERLRTLYGLTPAEARLAARLAAGDALKSAAAAIGIGYPTARSQLAAVFRKTETRRQGDLIRLMLTTIPLLQS